MIDVIIVKMFIMIANPIAIHDLIMSDVICSVLWL